MKSFIKKIIPPSFINFYHFFLSFLGAFIYGFPSKKMFVIGVTGTEGKSTTVFLIAKILEEAGFKIASSSSISFKINGKEQENRLKMTMPGRLKLQRFLKNAKKSKCDYAILEVTSEGILQHRQKFIDFNEVVFTNLFPEHIERHGSFENYRAAKGKLFQQCKEKHILNLDDGNVDYFLKFPAKEKWGYTLGKKKEKKETELSEIFKAEDVDIKPEKTSFYIEGLKIDLFLPGEFNVYNALAAISVARSLGVSLDVCKSAIEKVKAVPGRMETVLSYPFKLIVDYAHTPDALEKVYRTLIKAKKNEGNLICVLGACGGGRDKWKRPELGRIAAEYCHKIILTNEDPYDEDPEKILFMVEAGVVKNKVKIENFYKILDRREAIRKAISLAKKNDIIIITGKGSEPWICVANGKKIPWSDAKVAQEEALKAKNKR